VRSAIQGRNGFRAGATEEVALGQTHSQLPQDLHFTFVFHRLCDEQPAVFARQADHAGHRIAVVGVAMDVGRPARSHLDQIGQYLGPDPHAGVGRFEIIQRNRHAGRPQGPQRGNQRINGGQAGVTCEVDPHARRGQLVFAQQLQQRINGVGLMQLHQRLGAHIDK